MKTIYFHIGYPKAASTFLQKGIFPNIKNLNFLNKSYDYEFEKLLSLIFYSTDDEFIKSYEKYSEFFENINDRFTNIFSSEGFTTFGGKKNFQISYIFERLKLVATKKSIKIKIYLVIRNQCDYLLTRYAQGHGENSFYSVNKEYEKFKNVINFFRLEENERKPEEKNLFQTFNYYKEIINLKKVFGDENVFVGIFENLNENMDLFLKDLFSFLKLNLSENYENLDLRKKNPGKRSSQNEYFRRKHLSTKPIKGSLNIIASFLPFKKFFFKIFSRKLKDKVKILSYQLDRILLNHDRIILNQEDRKMIKKYYEVDNIKLSRLLNIDLKRFNY